MKPVWKDFDETFTSTEPYKYSIGAYNEDVVFDGVAVPKPNTNQISIRISDFAKNIVNSNVDINFEDGVGYRMKDYCKDICLFDADGRIDMSWWFYNSYDYNNQFNIIDDTTNVISNPITTFATGGYVLISIFVGVSANEDEITITNLDTNRDNIVDWLIQYGDAQVICIKPTEPGTYVVTTTEFGEIFRFVVEDKCVKYNLHYQNAAGGYDTISIDGRRDKRTDDLTFDYYKSKGNNQNWNNPQMNKFKVDITPKWELQTGWLNDEQSKKMYNLFTSQKVFLEDINEGTITPVYITNNAVNYKTFTNNGRKKYNYSISVTSANTLIKL